MPFRFSHIIVYASILLLSACSSRPVVQQEYISNKNHTFSVSVVEDVKIARDGNKVFKDALIKRLSEVQKYKSSSSLIVEVTFKEYYMRHGAAKAMVGIFAGVDKVVTDVRVKDRNTGKTLGKCELKTTNATAIISAASVLDQHAKQVVKFLNK